MRFIYFFYDFVKCVCLIVFSVFFHNIFHDYFCDFYSKLDLYGTFQFKSSSIFFYYTYVTLAFKDRQPIQVHRLILTTTIRVKPVQVA